MGLNNLKQNAKLFLINTYIKLSLFKENIKIKKVKSKEELNQIRHFIWKVYAIEKGYIDPNFFKERMFIDEFDENSIYFSAVKNKEIVGGVRIVLNSEKGFPIEKLYELEKLEIDRNKIAEISRLIAVTHSSKNDVVALALCKSCFIYSRRLGIEYWYAFLPEKLKNYFEKKYGIPFIEVKFLPISPEKEKARIPYRFYFSNFNPKPYLIPLKEILNRFRI
ncbi:GNAT family N-acetyltransferase [Candidatus Parcubacteria bacterium]|nr:GNAT family N-acetyltransferase [Candidatus Parcubacteria bacterium]